MHSLDDSTNQQGLSASEGTCCRDCLRAEVTSALCLDSLMLLASAEHLLDHFDRRRGDLS